MKPNKNLVFCHGCMRHKMLFDSQSKADNFIKYNSDEILEENGKAPVRSYYCEICCGFHVTSNPSVESGDRFANLDHKRIVRITQLHKETDEVKKMLELLEKSIDNARNTLYVGDFVEAEKLLDACFFSINEIRSFTPNGSSKLTNLRVKADGLKELLQIINHYRNLSLEDAEIFLQTLEKPDTIRTIFKAKSILEEVKNLLSKNDELIDNEKFEGVLDNIDLCKKHLESVKSTNTKKAVGFYRDLVEKQTARYNKTLKRIKHLELEKEFKAKKQQKLEQQEKERQEQKQQESLPYIDKEEYRQTIICLIERLEKIQIKYESGDFEECDRLIDIGLIILDELNISDENTELLRSHFNQWMARLNR